jgi:hypothetical protein
MPAHTSTEFRDANPRGKRRIIVHSNFFIQNNRRRRRGCSPGPRRTGNGYEPKGGSSWSVPKLYERTRNKFYAKREAQQWMDCKC